MRKERQIERTSLWTGKHNVMTIQMTDAEYESVTWALRNGFYRDIQSILPNNTPEEREFILSGVTPIERKREFGLYT